MVVQELEEVHQENQELRAELEGAYGSHLGSPETPHQ